MRTLLAFILAYPQRSSIMLAALLVAGLAEGLSLTTLLPLLSTVGGESTESGVGAYIVQNLRAIGIEPSIGVMLLVIVGGMIVRSLLVLLANRQVGFTVAHVATSLRLELIEALLASRWEYYLRQKTGSLANSVATEAYRAATGFEFGANAIAFFLQVVVYAAVAFMISWQATLISLVIGVIFLAVLHRLVDAAGRAGSRQTQLLRSLLSYLTDVLSSVKPLKAMARDNVSDAILREQTIQLETAMRKEVISKETLRALQEPMLAALAAAGLYVTIVWLQQTLVSVMVLVFLLTRVLGLLNKTQRRFQQMKAQESAYWALRAAAEEARSASESLTGTKQPSLEHSINVRNVWFNYGAISVFRGLNMQIPVKALTVVVGSSGIGKSTLLDLLCALTRPDRGEILVDGVSLNDIDLRRWRHMIGYVPQDTILLHDSILNNIIIGEPDLTEADAERALRQAGAWGFVAAFPQGIHTVIGERGGRLSGGQRQRIAIARALAHQPRFLILDEPTNALDPDSERVICDTLRTLSNNLTLIAVSHQTAVIDAADQLFRLSDGKAISIENKSVPEKKEAVV
ncbi:MAG: ABC transporter ATP-binding protein [Gammaproteobacteria bacterium]|nr:ABC transporter ATP-binding protein [Gammaproteobacteria bacterium]